MILVDPLKHYPDRPYGHPEWCHMGTDNLSASGLDELHAFARRLGLKRAWFQDKPGLPHYDITAPKRAWALRYGAVQVSPRDFVRQIRRTTGAVDEHLYAGALDPSHDGG